MQEWERVRHRGLPLLEPSSELLSEPWSVSEPKLLLVWAPEDVQEQGR